MYIPSDQIWIPDIVLYNKLVVVIAIQNNYRQSFHKISFDFTVSYSADGKYQVSLMTKAAVYSNGTVVWQPPALYKSMCPIDIEFFPFDTQNCEMRFGKHIINTVCKIVSDSDCKRVSGSWTYDGVEVDLIHYDQDKVQHGSYTVGPNAGLNYTVVMDAVDLTDYYPSGEFDIIATPAKRHEQYFQCCNAPFVDITYMVSNSYIIVSTNIIE